MNTIIILILIIGAIFLLVFLISAFLTKRRLIKTFRNNNVIVFGKKGTGKDLLTEEIISCRKAPYYSNIDYGGKCTLIKADDMKLGKNTYNNFIKGVIEPTKKEWNENIDWYFSDVGIILPSQYDSILHKYYPSYPIFYALSRHLYNANVHVNTQNLERVWKALREQADSYIKTLKVIKLGFCFLIKTRQFDRYQSAVNDIRPIKHRLLNKYSKGDQDTYEASNGEIKEGWLIVWRWHIKYDTRAYHKIVFGEKAPKRKTLMARLKERKKKKASK